MKRKQVSAETSHTLRPIIFRQVAGAMLAANFVAAVGLGQTLDRTTSLASPQGSGDPPIVFDWEVVVNNSVTVPGDSRKFNSYNQPSLNVNRLVVFRGRSKGGTSGEPAHGIFLRDMAQGTALVTVFDRTTPVPDPNNVGATFNEPPSFPRIDMWSSALASRGNHQPVWDDGVTRAGITGIYTTPFGELITGASNLGAVPEFAFFAVPGEGATKFDVFPGAPTVTDGRTIVFKGNYTLLGGQTGVYYRDLQDAPAGGAGPIIPIADTSTTIPQTTQLFGSTAPPSAAGREAVFAGFDNEETPASGGIYLVPLTGPWPDLNVLVAIGSHVPGEKPGTVFNRLGEAVSFDGRFVGFWGAWGSEMKTEILMCTGEGNKLRAEYCMEQYPNGYTATVPVHQGIFVHDTFTHTTWPVAKAPEDFDDFVYWNFTGMVAGTGESEDAGEPARWRSATYLAVSGLVDGQLNDATFHTAFKARKGEVDGIYLRQGPGKPPLAVLVQTGMDGGQIDPAAAGLPVTEMGLERDGFRGDSIAISLGMGTEAAGWAGIYLTTVPRALNQ